MPKPKADRLTPTRADLLLRAMKDELDSVEPCYRKHMMLCIEEAMQGNLRALVKYKHMPVDVKTFIEDPYYMDAMITDDLTGERTPILYPEVMRNLAEINEGAYDEVVCTGGIGSGKTTIALYTQAVQLYLLSCMKNPQGYFGLDPSHEIVIVFQSLNKKLAEELDYERFKHMIERSPYFQEKFPHNKYVENQLEFPNRIIVKPIAGTTTGAISQNVIGGLIDEINFMQVVEHSKQAEGQTFDQATALYNSIATRRMTRFSKMGRMPGRLCLVSSRKTPGQFTDVKEAEAKTNKRIFIYDKRVWDVVPPGRFSEERFQVFVGDGNRQPRLLEDNEVIPDEDRHLIDLIPIEFKKRFIDDIQEALRDVAGRSTLALHPFMPLRDKVTANFGKRHSVLAQEGVDFSRERVKIRLQLATRNSEFPRWGHIDLGVVSDSAGMVIGHVPRFVGSKNEDGVIELMPQIEIDCALELIPPKGHGRGEVDFGMIRKILYKLRDLGMPIKWVSFDSYQSTDSMQILRRNGFVVGYQSIDTDPGPYNLTKAALYDKRVLAPHHAKLVKELTSLERDFKKGKVDHPPKGSKDVADALAGVVYGLTTRRDVWAQHRVNIMMSSVSSMVREKDQERGQTHAA